MLNSSKHEDAVQNGVPPCENFREDHEGEEVVLLRCDVYDTGIGIPGFSLAFVDYVLHDHLLHISLDTWNMFVFISDFFSMSDHLQRSHCHCCLRGTCKPVLIMQENTAGQGLALQYASSWYEFSVLKS